MMDTSDNSAVETTDKSFPSSPSSVYQYSRSDSPFSSASTDSSCDTRFADYISQYMKQELAKLEGGDFSAEDVFLVYSDVFNRVINHMNNTKIIMSLVKYEYERCIETLKKSQRESVFLTGHLKAKASEPSTIRNYQIRIDDLASKIRVIKEENLRVREELIDLHEKRGREHQRLRIERENANSSQEFTDTDLAPGLTLVEATDLKELRAKSFELEATIDHLKNLQHSSYQLRENKEKTKDALLEKMASIDEVKKSILDVRTKKMHLRIAVDAAEAFIAAPPVGMTIGEYVINALKTAAASLPPPSTKLNLDQMDMLTDFSGDREGSAAMIHDEKEAEALMEYLQQFTLLFDSGKYAEAATCAANSPKGILRNYETLLKFKDVSSRMKVKFGEASPLLLFCQSLLVGVGLGTPKLDERMSLECVKVALDEERLELVSHWIAQDKLMLSQQLGKALLDFAHMTGDDVKSPTSPMELVALAQHVFHSVDDHQMTAQCIFMQGLNRAFVNHCKKRGLDFTEGDYSRFFLAVVEISSALRGRASTSEARQTILAANAGFVLVAPSESASDELPVKNEEENKISEKDKSEKTGSEKTGSEKTGSGAKPEKDAPRTKSDDGRGTGVLPLGAVVETLLKADFDAAVVKLVLRIEKELTRQGVCDMVKADDSNVNWEYVANIVRSVGHTDLANAIMKVL